MEDKAARLLFGDGNPRPLDASRSIKDLSAAIIEANEGFHSLRSFSNNTVINVYSEEKDETLQVSCNVPLQDL